MLSMSISTICLMFVMIKGLEVNKGYSVYESAYDNKYHITDAVAILSVKSLTLCLSECTRNFRCLSFFFNQLTYGCILHSNPFTYTIMKNSGTGWKFFRMVDGTGRCPEDYFYYRHLDLCYTFQPLVNAHGPSIISSCNTLGAELIRIDSEEKQQYLKHIAVNIGKVYPAGICIQGTNLLHPSKIWTFDDGTMMTYFNWHAGEPSRNGYIRIVRGKDYGWGVPLIPTSWTCSYICEKR